MSEEIKEPLAPSKQQIVDVWKAMNLAGKPSAEATSKLIRAVEVDIDSYSKLESQDELIKENMNTYLHQLTKLHEGIVASHNVGFIEGHALAIESFKKVHGEETHLPVQYDELGRLRWINRKSRR